MHLLSLYQCRVVGVVRSTVVHQLARDRVADAPLLDVGFTRHPLNRFSSNEARREVIPPPPPAAQIYCAGVHWVSDLCRALPVL